MGPDQAGRNTQGRYVGGLLGLGRLPARHAHDGENLTLAATWTFRRQAKLRK